MYEKKLATASELCEHLATCRDILAEKEYELEKYDYQEIIINHNVSLD